MNLVMLSGGSGKRLWPLSNDIRSKQFLQLLDSPTGKKESMVQRIIRQLKGSGLDVEVTFATSETQKESILNQIGNHVNIVTEPERRDTFPAIALAVAYLKLQKNLGDDEIIVVMPCDSFIDESYFDAIARMGKAIEGDEAQLVLMGIKPTEPSSKFGYIVPDKNYDDADSDEVIKILRFTEKPDLDEAVRLIAKGALWNGGVFAFRLGFVAEILSRYVALKSYDYVRSHYSDLPKISFDYEVAEKTDSIAAVTFSGKWKDLGTWNSLSTELTDRIHGNAFLVDDCDNTTVINELSMPVLCMDVRDLIVVASNDGILISTKASSENLKEHVKSLTDQPRYIEYEWGSMRTLEEYHNPDNSVCRVTELNIKTGKTAIFNIEDGESAACSVIAGAGVIDCVSADVERKSEIILSPTTTFSMTSRKNYSISATSSLKILATFTVL